MRPFAAALLGCLALTACGGHEDYDPHGEGVRRYGAM